MSSVELSVKGGARMKAYLEALRAAVGGANAVRVGFLEDATYPAQAKRDELHIAQVAFWNEFGTSGAPARPFFRGMINRESNHWGADLGGYLISVAYDAGRALAMLGLSVKDALTHAIASWPADNAPSTVAKKGFNHGLIDKGLMQRAPDFEVLG